MIRSILVIFLVILIPWLIWASFSTGGLYELKQINPKYEHPNKHVAYLVSILNYSESSGLWDSDHVEFCSLYMPNWKKAEECVKNRLYCELKAPTKKDIFSDKRDPDILSDEYRKCWDERRLYLGVMEYLRVSRALFRYGLLLFGVWITGGAETENHEDDKWMKKNKYWAEPLEAWANKGR